MTRFRLILPALLAATFNIAAYATDGTFAIAVLKSEASIEAKARACQHLAILGDARAIPYLAELLSDQALAAYALTALEAIEEPEAAQALRSALPSLEGEQLIGVVTAIGVKGDTQSAEALAALAKDETNVASYAALIALAQITSKQSENAILSALRSDSSNHRSNAADAALLAADKAMRNGEMKTARTYAKAIRAARVPEHIQKAATALLDRF